MSTTGGPTLIVRRPRPVMGPPAPRRRPSAGPAGPVRVVQPKGPQRRPVTRTGSLGPAGQPKPIQGPQRPLSKAELAARYTHTQPARRVIAPAHPPLVDRVAGGLLNAVTHPGRYVIGTSPTAGVGHHHLPGATATPGMAVAGPAQSVPALALKNIAVASWQHPGAVAGNTAKGLGEIIAGTPAGIAGLVLHPTTIGQLPSAIGHDFSRRYGPLVSGNEKAFRQRIVKEGAAPELLDFTSIGGSGGAAAGRALSKVARAGQLDRLSPALREIATVRPALRVSGGLAKEQDVSPNLFRAIGQHAEDRLRQQRLEGKGVKIGPVRVGAGRNVRAGELRGVQPRAIEGPVVNATEKTVRGPGEVVPIFQARAQRIAVSRRAARSYLANKREQAIELQKGVERDIATLKPAERQGVFHVMSGIVPLRKQGEADTAYFGRVKGAIEARKAQIEGHHATAKATGKSVPVPVHPDSELHTLNRLEQNIPETFGGTGLAGFHARNLPRSRRLAALDPALGAEGGIHPYRVQGETLGLRYQPPEGLKGKDLAAFDAHYVQQVKAEAAHRGLQDPAYFRHQEFATSGFGNRTAANLRRAVAGPKRSELKLFRRGAAITNPDVFTQGLAGNIKRRHQWAAVADTVDAHALPWSRKPNGQGRSVLALRREIQQRGLNPDDFEFIDFRRFRKAVNATDEGVGTEAQVRGRFDGAVRDASILEGKKSELKALQGFVAVPKGVGEELNAALRPAGKPLRVLGRVQGFQSAAILGLNPSWLQMQVAANTLQYGLGTRGNFKDLLASQKWYRDLPDNMKARVDEYSSVGAGMGHATQPQLGSHAGSIAQRARAIGQIPLIRSKHGTIRVTDLNPTRPLFAIDEAQNRAFRRGAFYNAAKTQAFKNMKREVSAGAAQARKVEQLLKLTPGEDLSHQLERVLQNPQQIEKLGEHVDRVLGDYLRYTSKERTYLKPTVIFYGFMRYALKTLFYTLPVRHPIAGAIAAKLGQLHNDELRRMFGTRDVPPWILSRVYRTDSHGNPVRDSKGQLEAIDLARINPVSSPVVDATQSGPSAFAGIGSPLYQAFEDQIYSKSAFKNRGFRVHGSAEENPNPDVPTRLRIAANQLGQTAFPYREAEKLTQAGTQGDDTLLGSPRPIRYKTAGPQAQETQRRQLRPSVLDQLRSDLAPLAFPKRDSSTETQIGQRAGGQAPAGPRTPADRERLLLIREAQQAAQQSAPSERERRLLIKEALAARG